MSSNPVQDAEVKWYRRYGRYPTARIRLDSSQCEYVIGDWAWNRAPGSPHEEVEPQMDRVTWSLTAAKLAQRKARGTKKPQ